MRAAGFFGAAALAVRPSRPHRRTQRLHQIDDGRLLASAASAVELVALELRLEQLAQRRAVLAPELAGIELALEARR